jgi:hypothetical protein
VGLSEEQLAAFQRDGFVVVRRFLDPRTVATLREACRAHFRTQTGCPVGGGVVEADLGKRMPEVGRMLTHPPALEIAQQLVGTNIVHPYQDAVHVGAVNRGWHKDARDYLRPSDDPTDWSEDYRLVHFAYYLQDHIAHSGAISFRRGSHRNTSVTDGEIVTPEVHAGDLVIFDLRTTHYGNTLMLRPALRRFRPTVFMDALWSSTRFALLRPLARRLIRRLSWLFLPEHGTERLVIFFVYGADDRHSRRFFDYLRGEPDYPYLAAYDEPLRLTDQERER